jgi:hypothetical protein
LYLIAEDEKDKTSHVINLFAAHKRNLEIEERVEKQDKRLINVAPLEWIRVNLTVCDVASFRFGDGCVGSDPKKDRQSVRIYSRNGFVLSMCILYSC